MTELPSRSNAAELVGVLERQLFAARYSLADALESLHALGQLEPLDPTATAGLRDQVMGALVALRKAQGIIDRGPHA